MVEVHLPAAVIDGVRMPLHDARLPVTDAGVARGDGAFETVGVWGGTPFELDAHLARLARSLALVGLDPVDGRALAGDAAALVEGRCGDAALRIYATGSGTRVLTLDRLPVRPLPERLAPRPAPWITPAADGGPGGPKTMSYQPNMAASRAAGAGGADDALLVSAGGLVLEGPTFAVLWIRDGVLHAPDLQLGIIDSISRRTLQRIAAAAGIDVVAGRWGIDALAGASEVMAVSALRDLVAVREVVGVGRWPGATPMRDLLAAGLWRARGRAA